MSSSSNQQVTKVSKHFRSFKIGGSGRNNIGDRYQYGNKFVIKRANLHVSGASDSAPQAPNARSKALVVYRNRLETLIEQSSDYKAGSEQWRRLHVKVAGTCEWILENEKFQQWLCGKPRAALVIAGPIGCGKSMIAASLINHLSNGDVFSRVIHYYVDGTAPKYNSLECVGRGLIKQCLTELSIGPSTEGLAELSKVEAAFANYLFFSAPSEIGKLVALLLSLLGNALLVLDGVDELEQTSMQDVFGMLRTIFAPAQVHNCKLLLVTRDILGYGLDVSLQLSTLESVQIMHLDHKYLRADIVRFIDVKVDEAQLRRPITADEHVLSLIKDKLADHGKEMFLWIELQIKSLWSVEDVLSDAQIRAYLEDLPRDLDQTYAKCLRQILARPERAQRVAFNTFRWVVTATKPLNKVTLRSLVMWSTSEDGYDVSGFNGPIVEFCANMLTEDVVECVKFTHLSAQQYLLTDEAGTMFAHLGSTSFLSINRWCGDICLKYISEVQQSTQLSSDRRTVAADSIIASSASVVPGFGMVRGLLDSLNRRPPPRIQTALGAHQRPLLLSQKAHQYIVLNWLEHLRHTSYDHLDARVRLIALCKQPLRITFRFLDTNGETEQIWGRLIYHAVIINHLLLLGCAYAVAGVPGVSWWYKNVAESSLIVENPRILLHHAAALGHVETATFLINKNSASVNNYDGFACRPLAYAVQNRRLHVIELLLRYRSTERREIRPDPVFSRHQNLSGDALLRKARGTEAMESLFEVAVQQDDCSVLKCILNCLNIHDSSNYLHDSRASIILYKGLMCRNYDFLRALKDFIPLDRLERPDYYKNIMNANVRGSQQIYPPPDEILQVPFAQSNGATLKFIADVGMSTRWVKEAVQRNIEHIIKLLDSNTETALPSTLSLVELLCDHGLLSDISVDTLLARLIRTLLIRSHMGSVRRHNCILLGYLLCKIYSSAPPGFTYLLESADILNFLRHDLPDRVLLILLRNTEGEIFTEEYLYLIFARSSCRIIHCLLGRRATDDAWAIDSMRLMRNDYGKCESTITRPTALSLARSTLLDFPRMDLVQRARWSTDPWPIWCTPSAQQLYMHLETQGESIWSSQRPVDAVKTSFELERSVQIARNDIAKAAEIFLSLRAVKSDFVLALNYPRGYLRGPSTELCIVDPVILHAVYRWNWRLRRKKCSPTSTSDILFCALHWRGVTRSVRWWTEYRGFYRRFDPQRFNNLQRFFGTHKVR